MTDAYLWFDTLWLNQEFSRTPDRNTNCFYPCEIILSHIPVPARGKDKNEQPHVNRTSIRDVITSLCRTLALSEFSVVQYKKSYSVVSKKKSIIRVRMG